MQDDVEDDVKIGQYLYRMLCLDMYTCAYRYT